MFLCFVIWFFVGGTQHCLTGLDKAFSRKATVEEGRGRKSQPRNFSFLTIFLGFISRGHRVISFISSLSG